MRNGEHHAAFRSAIELAKNKPADLHRILKTPRLAQCVLAGSGVEHQHHFMRHIGIKFLQHAHDLFQFLHQVALVVQAAGGVGYQNVYSFCTRRLVRVEDYRGAVSTRMLGDDIYVVAIAPGLQLLDGSGAKGVAGRKKHGASFLLEVLGEFADGCSFADTVHANHEYHEGFARRGRYVQRRFAGREHGAQDFFEGDIQRIRIGKFLALETRREFTKDGSSGLDANIGGQEARFELVQQVLIDGFLAEQQRTEACRQRSAGTAESGKQFAEEAAGFFFRLADAKHRENCCEGDKFAC